MFLSLSRLEKLSDISSDIGQIFFASALVEPAISGTVNWKLFLGGLILSVLAWTSSLLLTKENYE